MSCWGRVRPDHVPVISRREVTAFVPRFGANEPTSQKELGVVGTDLTVAADAKRRVRGQRWSITVSTRRTRSGRIRIHLS